MNQIETKEEQKILSSPLQSDFISEIEKGKKRKSFSKSIKRDFRLNWQAYLLILPVILYFFVLNYIPMGGLIMAFQNYRFADGWFGSQWVGFKHFIDFFANPAFFNIIRNTFVISLLGLLIGFPSSIVFALLINEIHHKLFKRTVQTISYLPYFVSMVVICGLIIDFVSSHGIITNFLVRLGMERQNLLNNPSYFWTINLLSDMWQSLGYGSILFLAAITNVNPELHEAAIIDGANRFRRVWHITIPGIMPVIITMLILRTGLLMTVGFEKILLLYNPSIYETADVIATHVQRMGIVRAQYSYAAAVGFFNSVVGTILLLGSNALAKKYSETSIM